MNSPKFTPCLVALLAASGTLTASAQTSELEELKAKMRLMEQTMQEMKQRITELETQKAIPPAVIPAPETPEAADTARVSFRQMVTEIIGRASPIEDRGTLNNQQEGAQRPNDLTLDPQYRGYVPVPNTPVLIKFNAKPRVDAIFDDKNSGNSDRFVPALIPTKGSSAYGGGHQFDMNAKGSQLSLDVRAPEIPGNFRFYYQNDFFGSGGSMDYRLKQLYGQIFNVTAGFTFSVFEDPDVWPDTLDYEGPNSAIFARQATVRYLLPLTDEWQLNFGIQEPGADIDGGPTGPFSGATANNQFPDGGMNVRWERAKVGHVQLATILRDIGARNDGDEQNVFGWGFNLSAVFNVFRRDSIQAQATYGEGIFHFVNDNFFNNDAAYDNNGDLAALPYFGLMAGYTHRWNDVLRSTASFGFAHLDNEPSQGPDAYHETYYGSLNLVWQLRKRLSVGLEGLYGRKEVQSGDHGDVFRVQAGMVYSLFD